MLLLLLLLLVTVGQVTVVVTSGSGITVQPRVSMPVLLVRVPVLLRRGVRVGRVVVRAVLWRLLLVRMMIVATTMAVGGMLQMMMRMAL